MMNYIKQLQAKIEEQDIALARYNVGMQELAGYLTSPKFYEDTTVQTSDMLSRLAELKSYAEAEQ